MGQEERALQGTLPQARRDDLVVPRVQRDEVGERARPSMRTEHVIRRSGCAFLDKAHGKDGCFAAEEEKGGAPRVEGKEKRKPCSRAPR